MTEAVSRMTSLDLAAIRQRVEKATEGPWNTGFDYEKNDPIVLAPGYIEHTIDYTLTEGGLEHGKADAEFIAHAREDIPALLDEIDRLNATIQRVRKIVTDPQTVGWIERDGDTAWIPAERIRKALGIHEEPLSKRHPAMSREDLRRAFEGGEAS